MILIVFVTEHYSTSIARLQRIMRKVTAKGEFGSAVGNEGDDDEDDDASADEADVEEAGPDLALRLRPVRLSSSEALRGNSSGKLKNNHV